MVEWEWGELEGRTHGQGGLRPKAGINHRATEEPKQEFQPTTRGAWIPPLRQCWGVGGMGGGGGRKWLSPLQVCGVGLGWSEAHSCLSTKGSSAGPSSGAGGVAAASPVL